MNFFIDFDHTLYDTSLLIKDILNSLAKYIEKKSNQNIDEILLNLKEKFARGKDKIYDTYELIGYFSKPDKYNYDKNEATDIVNKVIFDGKKYLYDDVIPFLKYLKENNHNVYILTYSESGLKYQLNKLIGSGLLEFVSGVFPTTTMKGKMPFDFSKCVFIDDKPKDLISIYENHPYKIFRINRPDEKYSNEKINLPIEEVNSLIDITKKIS